MIMSKEWIEKAESSSSIIHIYYNFRILLCTIGDAEPQEAFHDPKVGMNVMSDEDISPLHTMQGPIIRAHARQLDLQVRSNVVNYFSELMLGSMHILLTRNDGEDQ
jgi:hypothetical protein